MVEKMGTTIKDRHNFFRCLDPDFVAALKSILDSDDSNDDEKYEALVKELKGMWPHETEKFLDTNLKQFELMIDFEVFTCVIVAEEDRIRGEVVQYFKEMLRAPETKPVTFDLSALELIKEPIN